MRVPLHVVEDRRRHLADYLQQHAYAPLKEVCTQFHTSAATARRDLAVLAARKQIVRTHGGALTEYNRRFPSFRDREGLHADAKHRIAVAARDRIAAGTMCFLDFGTTAFAIAEEICRRPLPGLQIVTNSLPVADRLISAPGVRVHLLGGELLARQSALLGKSASRALRFYPIDQAFLSAQAADAAGAWNSQNELVEFQRKVIAHATRRVLCLDASKLLGAAPAFLAPWSGFDLVVTDASARKLKDAKVTCETVCV